MTSELDSRATFGDGTAYAERDGKDLKLRDDALGFAVTLSDLVRGRRTETISLDINKNCLVYREPIPGLNTLSPTTNTNTKICAFSFDDSVEEFIGYSFRLPADLDPGGTVNVRFQWFPATASSNSVVWKIYYGAIDHGESIDVSLVSKSFVCAGNASTDVISDNVVSDTVASLGWAAGDHLILHISRASSDSSDTLSGDAHLIGLSIELPLRESGGAGDYSGAFDIQVFTENGVWAKPPEATSVLLYALAGGGGGGSGRKGASSSNRGGGGGGAGGAGVFGIFSPDLFGDVEVVTVGTGGAGAPAQSIDSTNGTSGTAGTNTVFGPFTVQAGAGGAAGSTATTGQAGTRTCSFELVSAVTVGGAGLGSPTAPTAGGGTVRCGLTGGGGGGCNTSNTQVAGASGGGYGTTFISSGLSGGTAGTAGGGAGGDGNDAQDLLFGGTAGGGGGGSTSIGGSGGDGGYPGTGGGGGGAGTDGGGNSSGAGGEGANGIVVVISIR